MENNRRDCLVIFLLPRLHGFLNSVEVFFTLQNALRGLSCGSSISPLFDPTSALQLSESSIRCHFVIADDFISELRGIVRIHFNC